MKKILAMGFLAALLASFGVSAVAGAANYYGSGIYNLNVGESVGSLPAGGDCSLNVLLTDLEEVNTTHTAAYTIEYAKNASVYASVILDEGESAVFEAQPCKTEEHYPQVDLSFVMVFSSAPSEAVTSIYFDESGSGPGNYTFPYAGSGTYQLNIGEGVLQSSAGNYPFIVLTDVTPFGFGPLNQPKITVECWNANGTNSGTAILMEGESDFLNGCGTVYAGEAYSGGGGTSYATVTVNFETAPVPTPYPSVVPTPSPSVAPSPEPHEVFPWNFEFAKGWNLFSIPVEGAGTAQTDCAPSSIWRYDAQAGAYARVGRLGDADLYLPSGFGYWFKANDACELTVNGDAYYSDYYEELSAGWNLIGAPSYIAAFSDLENDCEVKSGPWAYNPSTSSYEQSSELQSGKGYWVKVSSACTLSEGDEKPPAAPENPWIVKIG